jgi:hypothetical protein
MVGRQGRRLGRGRRAAHARGVRRRGRTLGAALLAASAALCCSRQTPLTVAISFENSWTVGGEALSGAEQARVRQAALDTVREAFTGFDVTVAEAPRGPRSIRVEDTPYGQMQFFGAAGVTYPAAYASSVRFDVLANLELAAVRCRDFAHCTAMPRERLVEGLGRGVGATAAHELGHQAGFRFGLDSHCADCYDSNESSSPAHFFGPLRWSDRARQIMRLTLPRKGT